MPLFEIISIAALLAIAWLWFDSVKVREISVQHAKAACDAEGLQFLDETVAISSLQPARDEEGRFILRRVYSFEYSDTGNDRRPGSIVMLGQNVLFVNVGLRLASQMPTLH
jgi:hypothetical protein